MAQLTVLSSFLREQRHIFGTCPHCHSLFRLVDARVSYDAPYRLDWMDRMENDQQSWEEKTANLKEREKEMRRAAIERATKTKLPRLLKSVVPAFAAHGLNPKDIKTVFHPIDFVVFDGLNRMKVDRVLLMDRRKSEAKQVSVQRNVVETLETGSV